MTKDRASELLLKLYQKADFTDEYGDMKDTESYEEALNIAIIALKNPILDKIKAEIEQRYCDIENDYDKGRNMGLRIATRVIDRYKAEIEYVEEDEELIIDKVQFEKYNKSIRK